MRISDWSSDVCSSDLLAGEAARPSGLTHQEGCGHGLPGQTRPRITIAGDNPRKRPLANWWGVRLALPPKASWGGRLAGSSEARRVGEEGASTCRSRWYPVP